MTRTKTITDADLKALFRAADDAHPVTRRSRRQPVDQEAYRNAHKAFIDTLRDARPNLTGWRRYDAGVYSYVQIAGDAGLLEW